MKNDDHHVIYEAARKRAKEKRGLYYHFLLFLVGLIMSLIFYRSASIDIRIPSVLSVPNLHLVRILF